MASVITTLSALRTKLWQNMKWLAGLAASRQVLEYFAATIVVFAVHPLMLVLPNVDWLPSNEHINSFLGTLWQVHATIIGLTVIVVTIIITVIANEGDRTRTWSLYSQRTKISLVLWFNLSLIVGEGLAFLETFRVDSPLIFTDADEILGLVVFVLFSISMVVVFLLLLETLRFLNQDYVEDLFEAQITKAIPQGIANDLQRIREFNRKWQQDNPDGS